MTLKSFMDLKKSLGTASIKGVTLLITLLLVSQLLIITPSYALTSTSITPISLGRHSVPEASGIVASRTYSDIYWMHSDWRGTPDDYAVYAVDDEGKTVKKIMVTGASHDNWEDIAIDENGNVWICDIGDNSQQRATYALYKIPEPNPYGSKTTVSVAATYRFALPDGSRDMDSCFVWQGIPYVIHKGTGARMYKIPSLDTSRTVTAQLVATFSKDSYIGGADISKDGRRLVFLSDTNDNQWVIERSASSTNVKDFFTAPIHEWELSFYNGAGGGIAFVNAKYDFVVSSESGGFWMVTQDMYDPSGPEPGDEGGTLSITTTPVNGEVFVDSTSWGVAPVSKSIEAGSHTVSFGAVSGYTTPADITVSVAAGGDVSVTGTYTEIPPPPTNGTLSVTTTPVNGEVFIDGTSWGVAPVSNVIVTGSHTVSFGAVPNYTKPANIAVSVDTGQNVSVIGNYTLIHPVVNGTLSVNTTPVKGEVFVNGTSWGVAPVSKSVTAGGYVVSFGSISGYTTPTDIAVSVAAGQNISVTGTYTLINSTLPTNGTLTVTTTPVNGEVFVDGTSWGVAPVSKSIAAGSHLVSFGAVSGYTEPDNIPVSVNAGNNAAVTGTYGLIIPPSNNPTYMLAFQGYDFNNKGEVSVLVNNQVVATLPTSYSPQNAQTYIDFSLNITNYVVAGSNTVTIRQNLYSGGVRNVVISNSSAVIYSNSTYYSMRAGGSRPSVTYSFTTTITTPLTGTLSVTTTPVNGEVFVDGTSWGLAPVSKSIAAGSHTVSFGSVAGYTTPASVTASVTDGLTTSVTGTYIPDNPPPNGQYTLSFQGYDYDNKGEVSVLVNNQVVASLPTVESSQNNNVWKSFSLDISNYIVSGSNTITFQQNLYSSGVQAVQVTESSSMLLDDNTPHDLWTGGTSSVTYTFSTLPPPDQGTLSVTTTPVNGEVFVNGTSWGVAPVSKSVAAGTYTVSFGSVAGYTTPSSVTVSVTAGLTTPVEGTYIPVAPLNGTLSVTTTPVNGEVFVDSISWGLAPVSNSVATGTHTVSFGAVPGYTAPSNVTVSVTAGVTTPVTGTYISTPSGNATGTSYMLSFQGYDFNNKGEVSVLVNNQVVATLPTSYAPQNKLVYVDFSLNITSYVVNGSNTVTIRQNLYSGGVRNVVISNSSAVIYSNSTYYSMRAGGSRPSVTYIFTTTITAPPPPINGTLSVTTTPVDGEVFVDSTSWGVAPVSKSIATGSHTVSFGAVSGYTTPADETVSVTAGLTTSVTGTYTEVSPPPSGQYTLNFQGYDYDSMAEVTVLVNNQFVVSLPESESAQNNNIFKSFTLDITTHIVSGTNTITFQQNLYSSGVQDVQVTAGSTVLLSNSTYYDLWVGGTTSITYTFMGEQISQLLQVSGNQIVDAFGSPVKMVGINYGHFKGAYGLDPRNYHQEAINIKNDGFNAVRLVVEWGNLETSANPSVFTYNETGINDVLNMIDELTGHGLYVIIKLHTDGEPRFRYVNLKNFLGDQYCNEDPDIGNAFNTRLGDNFYYQSHAANPTGPFAHFSEMWKTISEATRNNDKVVGYDLLNEPWTCITKSASEAVPIRAGWVSRVNELISELRSNGDNKIIFVEPAPMWSRFGDDYVGFTFTKQSDNNVVYSWHWYEGLASHSGAMTTCSGFPSMENLTRLWGNVKLDVDISCKDTPVWLKQAQDAYPNVPFDIGEFGNIYTNSEGDEDQQWIQNSIILFKAKNVTGYFYWSSKTTGTWISDIQASLPWNNPTTLTSYAREIPRALKDSTISPITYDNTSSPVLWKERDSTAIMVINQQPPLVTQPKTPTATR